jgi:hypothetical protein
MEVALARCVGTDGALTCMERNFINLNGCLSFPTRTWQKMGEPVSKNPIITNNINIGLNKKSPMKEKSMSKIRVILNMV